MLFLLSLCLPKGSPHRLTLLPARVRRCWSSKGTVPERQSITEKGPCSVFFGNCCPRALPKLSHHDAFCVSTARLPTTAAIFVPGSVQQMDGGGAFLCCVKATAYYTAWTFIEPRTASCWRRSGFAEPGGGNPGVNKLMVLGKWHCRIRDCIYMSSQRGRGN